MTKKFNWVTLLNITCAALLFVAFVLQFLPYWTVGDKSISIQGYVWFSTHNNDISRYLAKFTDVRFPANEIALTAVLSLVMGVVAPIICIKNYNKIGYSFLSLITGAICAIGYFTSGVFAAGSLGIVLGILNAVVVALSIPAMVQVVKSIIAWFTVKS